jgi:putative membrane protein
MGRAGRRRYLAVLVGGVSVLALGAAIAPVDRFTWALENALAVGSVGALVLSHRRLPLSLISYTLIALFLCLHEVGAHYTYSEVPYRQWFGSGAEGAGRNHYDRVVHFAYGLLLAYPIRELVLRVANVRGFWGYFLPLDFTMSTSMIYELIEWGVAEVAGGQGAAYLGSQGDEWDAHKDMLLASCGALLAMCVTAAINAALQRDFAREWNESLEVKGARPLGEVALSRLWRERAGR